jgi:hypothetical protein
MDLADLIGIEPMTSSMKWRSQNSRLQTINGLQAVATEKTAALLVVPATGSSRRETNERAGSAIQPDRNWEADRCV